MNNLKDSILKFLDNKTRLSYAYLLKWTFIALTAGVVGSTIVHVFAFLVISASVKISLTNIPVPLWSILGAFFVGAVIYRIQIHAAGEGVPSYIRGIRYHEGHLLTSVTFYKFWAALGTLATFGNGGIVGPLGRICSGTMSFIIRRLRFAFSKEDWHTACICGFAAAVGSIFHSSIGGGIFAVEVIKRAKMGYKDIFPAILASSASVFICKIMEWESFYNISVPDKFMDETMILGLILVIVLAGITGGFYVRFYGFVSKIIKRKEGNVLLKVILGTAIASTIAWIINPDIMGLSSNIIKNIAAGELDKMYGRIPVFIPIAMVLFFTSVVKGFCNCVTVGSGMSAGFTGPAAVMGMLLGAFVANLFGLESTSPTYYAFLAAGFCGMIASSMNIPLAAAVMTVEIFGLHYSFPAGFAAVVGFQVTRHTTIYDFALKEAEEDDDH